MKKEVIRNILEKNLKSDPDLIIENDRLVWISDVEDVVHKKITDHPFNDEELEVIRRLVSADKARVEHVVVRDIDQKNDVELLDNILNKIS